jgi:23S rRNA pseudouridine2605 synthase
MDCEERLQKIIAEAGLASRRKAELMIQEGRVTVNGTVVTQLGAKANLSRDHIKVDGKLLHDGAAKKYYILLNKPRQVISSVDDPQRRTRVTDLVNVKARVYPVGRLDYNTEGLILLTNDGVFAKIAGSAGIHLPKVYKVKVHSKPEESTLARLSKGIRLKTGDRLAPCKIRSISEANNSWYEVTLTQGKNRQIREMFETVGHPVHKLRRIRIGFLTDKGLEVGQYRFLTPEEVSRIMQLGAQTSGPHAGRKPALRSNRS